MSELSDRAQAARLLNQVVTDQRTTDQILGESEIAPLVRELLFGSLRFYFPLAACVTACLQKPLRKKDQDIFCLLIVGAYQLQHLRVPAHAAINETVNACRGLKKPWARGLVNAVLRQLPQSPQGNAAASHPDWLARSITASYPDLANQLFAANNRRAPMTLRVNTTRQSPAAYRQLLTDAGHEFLAGAQPETLTLRAPVAQASLPGYEAGWVAVQDAGAQFIPTLVLDLIKADPPLRLLDACAAPGGKFFHLLERLTPATAVALDISEGRLEALRSQGRRLGHSDYQALAGDASKLDWWDGQAFDLVLIDAPCSGSGTIRRHPDIRVLRNAEDIPRYAALQRKLLDNLWRTVRAGGTLLYCTCSILPEENDNVVSSFLHEHQVSVDEEPPATSEPQPASEYPLVRPLSLPQGHATEHGWQLLPSDGLEDNLAADTDGFYFAAFSKGPRA